MQVEQQQVLLDALNAFRALVVALQSASRVTWTDSAIAMLGRVEQIDPPEHWNIYEHSLVRDAVPTMIEAVESYNAVTERLR